MAYVEPVTLAARGIALVPLALAHESGLRVAAADGELWKLRVTSVPEPAQTRHYIEDALAMFEAGNRLAFAVTDAASGTVRVKFALDNRAGTHRAGGRCALAEK